MLSVPTPLPENVKDGLRSVIGNPSLEGARRLENALTDTFGKRVFGRINQKASIEAASESDRGIALMRKRMLEEAEIVARGGEPKVTIRDCDKNRCLTMPIIGRDKLINGYRLADALAQDRRTTRFPLMSREFIFQAGQPEEIRQAYRKAMGLDRVGSAV